MNRMCAVISSIFKRDRRRDYPVMLRLSGQNIDKVKTYAQKVADILRQDSNFNGMFIFDWEQKSKIVKVDLGSE